MVLKFVPRSVAGSTGQATRRVRLISKAFLSNAQGEAPPAGLSAAPLRSGERVSGAACHGRRAVRLMLAGWVPQDGVSAGAFALL